MPVRNLAAISAPDVAHHLGYRRRDHDLDRADRRYSTAPCYRWISIEQEAYQDHPERLTRLSE